MINQQTPNIGLPLPHPDNLLEEDIGRIRSAFSAIDSKIHVIDTLLASDDINLDTLQELVNAIKAAQSDLGLVDQLISGHLIAFGEEVATQIATLQSSVNSQLAAQAQQVNNQLQAVATQISGMQSTVDAMGALVYAGL